MTYREGLNDWNTLNASLNEDEYKLPTGLTGTALDIGGYLGSVGIALALDNPELRVVIVEPVPPNCDLIEENIALNGVGDRVTLIRGAVGRGGETVRVAYGFIGSESAEHHRFVGNSSTQRTAAAMETIEYRALGMSALPAFVEFVKIDCEGGEWGFIQHLRLIPTIVGEAHETPEHRPEDIADLLPFHDVTFDPEPSGARWFRAVLRA